LELISSWAFIQDNRGVMYIGNGYGVLEFDGSSWRLIQTTERSQCQSLAKDDDGRIYVGGTSDFGYLEPDSTGSMVYVSLGERLDPEDRAERLQYCRRGLFPNQSAALPVPSDLCRPQI
jgi:hypothetical protein